MLRRPTIMFLPEDAEGNAYRSESNLNNWPDATMRSSRSSNSRRCSPRSPSSRTSCLKPALRFGWRSIFFRMAASESMGAPLLQKLSHKYGECAASGFTPQSNESGCRDYLSNLGEQAPAQITYVLSTQPETVGNKDRMHVIGQSMNSGAGAGRRERKYPRVKVTLP